MAVRMVLGRLARSELRQASEHYRGISEALDVMHQRREPGYW